VPDFHSWRERLAAAGGTPPKRIRATRKSSREEDRQRSSHEQQMAEMDAAWGPIDPVWWWRESRSGTSFDRPTFQDLLSFCRAHPRSKGDPGRVEWWAPSRFGRSLDEHGEPDILTFISVYNEFERLGWELHFATLPRLGNSLAEVINIAVYAYAAAVYSKDLSRNAARGRREHGRNGWWINGQAPWGTLRRDTRENRTLGPKEISSPGSGGTILVEDPDILPHWKPAAQRFLSGASYKAIGDELYEAGLRGPQGGALGHKHIQNWLSNRHFIGFVKVRGEDGAPRWIDAQWDALVDSNLFERVQDEIQRRQSQPRNRKRASRGTFIIRPICAHCGGDYHGGRNSAKQRNERTYVHGKPGKGGDPDVYEAYRAEGCRGWSIIADEIEGAIKDLILQERASEGYEMEIRRLLSEKEEFRRGASDAVKAGEARIEALEQKQGSVVRHLTRAQGAGLDEDAFFEELNRIQQQLNAARADLEETREFARCRTAAWEHITQTINETRDLAATWDRVSLDERRILLDWWVLDVMIIVEPIPGMKRANQKTAVVTLRSAPDAPREFIIGHQTERANVNSSRTQLSSSTASRATTASPTSATTSEGTPSADAIRPSAHAECPRMSGSSSLSASTSTGTPSDDPQLPSATATLRSNPRRFARLTGDLRNLRVNSCCDSDINSMSLAPCTPSRGWNAGSSVILTNLERLNGHTSWQMSQP